MVQGVWNGAWCVKWPMVCEMTHDMWNGTWCVKWSMMREMVNDLHLYAATGKILTIFISFRWYHNYTQTSTRHFQSTDFLLETHNYIYMDVQENSPCARPDFIPVSMALITAPLITSGWSCERWSTTCLKSRSSRSGCSDNLICTNWRFPPRSLSKVSVASKNEMNQSILQYDSKNTHKRSFH